jgi:hypothetical protein
VTQDDLRGARRDHLATGMTFDNLVTIDVIGGEGTQLGKLWADDCSGRSRAHTLAGLCRTRTAGEYLICVDGGAGRPDCGYPR